MVIVMTKKKYQRFHKKPWDKARPGVVIFASFSEFFYSTLLSSSILFGFLCDLLRNITVIILRILLSSKLNHLVRYDEGCFINVLVFLT